MSAHPVAPTRRVPLAALRGAPLLLSLACRSHDGAGTDTIGRQWDSPILACQGWTAPAGETYPLRVDGAGVIVAVFGGTPRTQLGIARLRKEDGAMVWCRAGLYSGRIGEQDTTPLVAVIGGQGSDVLLLDARSGEERWRISVQLATQWSGGIGHSASERFAAYVASTDRRLEVLAVDVPTGRLLWQRTDTTDRPFDVTVRGAEVYGDTVLVYGVERLDANGVSRRGFLYGYSALSGAPLFRHNTGDSTTNLTDRPLRTPFGFVFGNNDGLALGVDRAGRVLWTRGGARGFIGPGTTPAMSGDTVYVGAADGTTTALDVATGRLLWRTSPGFSLTDVASCGETVLVQQEVVLYRLDRSTGRQVAVAGDDESRRPNPILGYLASNGRDAYGGGNGRVFRLRCN